MLSCVVVCFFIKEVQQYIDRFRAGAIKTHPWFQPDGSATFVTHPMNSRRHQVVEDQHGESFLKHGVVPFVSGAPWTVWSAEMTYPLQAISWATRCRAFYAKVKTHGNNPKIQDPTPDRRIPFQESTPDRPPPFRSQLLTDFHFSLNIIQDMKHNKASLRAGLPGVVTFSDAIPAHVIEFMMNYHNSADWQTGASFSFVELLNVVLQIEKGWKAYSHETRISVKSVGGSAAYERVYTEWLNENHPGKVASWKQYESAKARCMYLCICHVL